MTALDDAADVAVRSRRSSPTSRTPATSWCSASTRAVSRGRAATSLRYALERGIEAEFQLEDSELASEALPDPDGRGRMLFTESAEGGAGVLRRLHAEPDALARAARNALEIVPLRPRRQPTSASAEGARERCERLATTACSPTATRPTTRSIDRHAVRDLLLRLAAAATLAGQRRRARR